MKEKDVMDKNERDKRIFFIILSVIFICICVKNSKPQTDNQKIIIYSNKANTTVENDSPPITLTTSLHVKAAAVSQTTVSINTADVETTSAAEPLYININTADTAELSQLDGIGEVLAGRIVDYREMYGDFRNAEEIMQVHGIGEGIFSAIYPYIYVENPVYDTEIISDSDENNDTPDETYDEPEPDEPLISLEDVIPIDINTADVELLMLLPYVTGDIADKIIQLREDIGGYSHPYEIYYIGGLEEYQINEISKYVIAGK